MFCIVFLRLLVSTLKTGVVSTYTFTSSDLVLFQGVIQVQEKSQGTIILFYPSLLLLYCYLFPAILYIFIFLVFLTSYLLPRFFSYLWLISSYSLLWIFFHVLYLTIVGLKPVQLRNRLSASEHRKLTVLTSLIRTFPHWEFQRYKRIQDQKSTVDRCLSPASNVFTWTCSCVFRKHAEDVLKHLLGAFKPIGSFSFCNWQILGLLSHRCHELFQCLNLCGTLRE